MMIIAKLVTLVKKQGQNEVFFICSALQSLAQSSTIMTTFFPFFMQTLRGSLDQSISAPGALRASHPERRSDSAPGQPPGAALRPPER